MKLYKILTPGGSVQSERPGLVGGCLNTKIFGRLDCVYGKRMLKKNRVFFHSFEDAIRCGYRPCAHCRPMTEEDFEAIRPLAPVASLALYYRPKKFWNP